MIRASWARAKNGLCDLKLGVLAFFCFQMRSPIAPVSEYHPHLVWLLSNQAELPAPVHPEQSIKSVSGLVLGVCFSCSAFFFLSNARNWEGHGADHTGYVQTVLRLPSRALSVQFRPDHTSLELNLSFMLSFLPMKNIY